MKQMRIAVITNPMKLNKLESKGYTYLVDDK